jgi:hypothetical protein
MEIIINETKIDRWVARTLNTVEENCKIRFEENSQYSAQRSKKRENMKEK